MAKNSLKLELDLEPEATLDEQGHKAHDPD